MNQIAYCNRIIFLLIFISSIPLEAKLLKPTKGSKEKEILMVNGKRRLYYPISNEGTHYAVQGPTRIEFISRYPNSKYVPHAKQRMIYLRNLLAEHEIYVADFYMKRGAYLAAVGRAKYVIEHLPNTPQTPYALSILIEAYEILNYPELRDINLKILNSNFPDFDINQNLSVKKRSWKRILTLGLLGNEKIEKPEALNP